jgi:hypothetical protein
MAMTPQEMHDAFTAAYMYGDTERFNVLCDQLRSGELVLERTEEGYLIRSAYPEGESDS